MIDLSFFTCETFNLKLNMLRSYATRNFDEFSCCQSIADCLIEMNHFIDLANKNNANEYLVFTCNLVDLIVQLIEGCLLTKERTKKSKTNL